ncbi:expressed protein [Phakopsora pachyrhizi]|uniref:Expressed protein n=1 Tax=Phakopsora pachyrhizi TaxID=170000 RepID=A0AAV0AQC2_PHAPC|nr:expressed protein [Phakopsora pachyrhizi]CAH7669971.1 expressed protein [Phakopsora pachyrhizi]
MLFNKLAFALLFLVGITFSKLQPRNSVSSHAYTKNVIELQTGFNKVFYTIGTDFNQVLIYCRNSKLSDVIAYFSRVHSSVSALSSRCIIGFKYHDLAFRFSNYFFQILIKLQGALIVISQYRKMIIGCRGLFVSISVHLNHIIKYMNKANVDVLGMGRYYSRHINFNLFNLLGFSLNLDAY